MKKPFSPKNDPRTAYTCQLIKNTVFELLRAEPFPRITVTELCKKANINRGTFYLHYYDTSDVLDDMIQDILADTSHVLDHVLCPNRLTCHYPFCEKIQNSKEYQLLIFDDAASARLLDKLIEQGKEQFVTTLMQRGHLTFQQAEAIFVFQMHGCLAINRQMLKNKCPDWREIQQVIDGFIKAGIKQYI